MPGTFYLWTTNAPVGFYSFNQVNRNSANINISFSLPGTYIIQCQYNNPLAGCNGVSLFTVDVLPVFSFTGDENVCQNSTVTYTANGNTTWSVTPGWSDNNTDKFNDGRFHLEYSRCLYDNGNHHNHGCILQYNSSKSRKSPCGSHSQ